MPAIHRFGDLRGRHGDFGATTAFQNSINVKANGKGVVRAGVDNYNIHTDGSTAHYGTATPGSSTVSVNGSPVAITGDGVDSGCDSTLLAGSPDVSAGA